MNSEVWVAFDGRFGLGLDRDGDGTETETEEGGEAGCETQEGGVEEGGETDVETEIEAWNSHLNSL